MINNDKLKITTTSGRNTSISIGNIFNQSIAHCRKVPDGLAFSLTKHPSSGEQ